MSDVNSFTGVELLNVTILFATGVKLFDVQVFCFLLGVVATGLILPDPVGVIERIPVFVRGGFIIISRVGQPVKGANIFFLAKTIIFT